MSEEINREKRIREKLLAEEADERYLTEAIRRVILRLLTEERGYLPEEIETDREFPVSAGDTAETVRTDYIITIGGRRFMAIKCTVTPESSERHIVAFSRVVHDCVIPFSVVTDGTTTRLMDTATGKTLGEGMDCIFPREEALELVDRTGLSHYPADRLDKEKRILLAFESICCPIDKA
jgi:hypothetical protein